MNKLIEIALLLVATKPEKQEQQIQKILDKMGNKWAKILHNEGE
jgi:hypothetical protein